MQRISSDIIERHPSHNSIDYIHVAMVARAGHNAKLSTITIVFLL